MADDQDKSMKDVERELEDIKERADALDREIADAETRRPSKIDHAEDGGVI